MGGTGEGGGWGEAGWGDGVGGVQGVEMGAVGEAGRWTYREARGGGEDKD